MTASLYDSWTVGWLLKRLDSDVQRLGMVEAMTKSIVSRINLKVKNRSAVEKVLKTEPTLIICNHPSQAEVVILLGLLEKREDAYLVAEHSFLKILPNLDKHIIPVYISHKLCHHQKDSWKFWLLTRFHQTENYCQEVAHQKNIESINVAAEKINQGGLVIIFPAVGEEEGKFLNGVGYLIKQLKYPEKVNLVMANVKGTSTLDYLRIIPFLGKRLPSIEFSFAKPIKLGKLIRGEAKEITQRLQQAYGKVFGVRK